MLLGKDSLTFEDRPVPSIEDPHDVIVRIKHTGICGSDVHYWKEGGIGSYIVREPMVLGHESVGIVDSVGSKVSRVAVGDHVALEPGVPCRRCKQCKSGYYNLCADMAFAATPPIDGTLARFWTIAEDFCYKLPKDYPLVHGALAEPLAVAVHAVRQVEIAPGARVVVFGAGPVGLLILAVAKAYGASKLVSVDLNQDRLTFAEKYTGAKTFNPSTQNQSNGEDDPAQTTAKSIVDAANLNDEAGYSGADVVFDATGAEPCIRAGINVLRSGGTYVQVGMGKSNINWPILDMLVREVTVKSSFRYKEGDFDVAITLMTSGAINVAELISDRVPFGDAERAFGETSNGKGIKWIIDGPE